jgi:hypothetical protein
MHTIFPVRIQSIQSFRLAGILLSALLLLSLRVQAGPQSCQPNTSQFKSLSEQAAIASSENRLDEAAALYAKALALRPRWTEVDRRLVVTRHHRIRPRSLCESRSRFRESDCAG